MYLLPQHRWRFQANKLIEMGTSAVRYVDTRSFSWEPYFYGTRHGS
jgi:hypothetical protein